MPTEQDKDSEILEGLFEEVMKMIRQKQIRLESVVQRSIEQGDISQESFKRISEILAEYGKKKNWT